LIVISIATLALVAGVLFWLQTPRLVDFSPQPDSENVSAGESLRLVFSTAMQTESVESHISIEPAHSGKVTWEENAYIFTPDHPWQNSVTYQIKLTKGAQSNGWLRLKVSEEKTWSFTIEDPLLVYLYPADAPAQIYTINPLTGEQKQITDTEGEVLDFNVSNNGAFLFYSLSLNKSNSAIYFLNRASGESKLLLDCPAALCRFPQVSPQNDYLAFERTSLSQNDQTNIPQVWITALPPGFFSNSTAEITLSPQPAGDPQHQTQQPLWSSNGLLAFYDYTDAAYIIQSPRGEEINRFPSQTGEAGDWDSSGESFTFPEFITTPQTSSSLDDLNPIPASHLLRYSLKEKKPTDLTIMDYLEDNAPAFSPDGKVLVFARKYLDIVRWTPGRQMCILPLDSTEATAITDEPNYNHYAFTWKPDNRQIAYVRFNQTIMTEPPEIWLTNVDGSGQKLLVRNGYAPLWIP